MCFAIDAAMDMVNMSIELAEKTEDSRYYMDSMKLHKLLYLSQCAMLKTHKRSLFRDKIWAYRCGPYVDGIKSIPAKRGFGLIKNRFSREADDFVPPSVARRDILNRTLEEFGKKSTEELIQLTKNSTPYLKARRESAQTKDPEITRESMTNDRSLPQAG